MKDLHEKIFFEIEKGKSFSPDKLKSPRFSISRNN